MVPASHRGADQGEEVAVANFLDWRRESRSFESLGAWAPASFNTGGDVAGEPAERIQGAAVTSGGLAALGVPLLAGRLFTEAEERSDGPDARSAILSAERWRSRSAADPAAVGRQIRHGGETYTVVGILPAGGSTRSDASARA